MLCLAPRYGILIFWGRNIPNLGSATGELDSDLNLIEKDFPFPRKTLHFVFFPRGKTGVYDPV